MNEDFLDERYGVRAGKPAWHGLLQKKQHNEAMAFMLLFVFLVASSLASQ